jgi:hypothetical protein
MISHRAALFYRHANSIGCRDVSENQTTFFSGPSHIAGPEELSTTFLMKMPVLLRLTWAARRSDAR